MKLYDLTPAPNARRVRIFLAEKGVDIPRVEVDNSKGENRTEAYLARNPLGKMPVLELDDGTCISESLAICHYIEALHPEPPLFGRDPLERATVEMWERRMELELLLPTINVFVHTHPYWDGKVAQISAWGEACRTRVRETFEWLDRELADRAYIAGDAYSMADITAQCAIVLGKANDLRVPAEQTNLTAWWDRVAARPTARA